MSDQPLPFRSRSRTVPKTTLEEFRRLEQLLMRGAPTPIPEVESIQRRLLTILDDLDLRPAPGADRSQAARSRAAAASPVTASPVTASQSKVCQDSEAAVRRVTSKITVGPWKREKEVQSA